MKDPEKLKTMFWRRGFSALIDLVFIYSLAYLVHQLIIRIIFVDPVYVFALAWLLCYPASYLILKGRTPAKVITGMKVIGENDEEISVKHVILRELFGKFLVFLLVPAFLLARVHFYKTGQLTMPVVITLLVITLMVVLLLFFKRPWWEQLSSTKSVRSPLGRRSPGWISFLAILIVFTLTMTVKMAPFFTGKSDLATTFYPQYPVNAETREYADFIRAHSQDPVEYVFSLFDRYDLVVLDERLHEEATQYDLIKKIISDKRFAQKVGNLYTEIGTISDQDKLNVFMNTAFTNEDSLNKAAAAVERSCNPIWPLWGITGMFDLLKHVNHLNHGLTDSLRINWYFTDIPVNWETMTYDTWHAAPKNKRDKVMADHIAEIYQKKAANHETRNKGLVIMDVRHAFGMIRDKQGRKADHYFNTTNTTAILMDLLPGKVGNVLLNSVPFGLGIFLTPTQYGKWDRAFALAGNPDAGFDFENSPFGSDEFDNMLGSPPDGLKYKDVFTGFIFYKPLEQHVKKTGYPFMLDNFKDTLIRRAGCLGNGYDESTKRIIDIYDQDKTYTDRYPYAFFYNAIFNFGVSLMILLTLVIVLIYFLKK
jgi:uncharacterized RDD family membrane protein YckC